MMTSNRKGSRQMTKKKARIEIIDIAKAIRSVVKAASAKETKKVIVDMQ